MNIREKAIELGADWQEYDSAAEYLARRGKKGAVGDALPLNLSAACNALIDADPEAFEERVRQMAYALAMERNL